MSWERQRAKKPKYVVVFLYYVNTLLVIDRQTDRQSSLLNTLY